MATCLEKEDAVHLWTSDSDGGIHVLFNVRNTKGDVSMRWREGDGAKKSVVCGKGVVWSIDSGRGYLSLRTGVGWESPLGKKWSTTEQSATRIAVGSECLVLLNEDTTSVLACSVPSSAAIMRDSLHLTFTSLPSPPKHFNHLLMDDNHTLYGITTNGEVYMYKGAESCNHGIKEWAESGGWVFLCKPPPVARRGGFLSSLFFSERSLFLDATLTNGQIFLLRTDPQEVWQLVITEVTFGDQSQLKTAWNCFKFKDRALQLSLITSNPLNNRELFAVTGDGNTLVCLHLEGQFVTHSELPFHACGDIKITSLSACHLVVTTPPATPTPGVYPKLPKLDTESTLVINVGDPNWDTEYRDLLAANVSRWRKGEEYHLPRLVQPPSGQGLKRSRGSEGTLTPPSKRSPFVWCKVAAVSRRQLLVEGIDVYINIPNKVPAVIHPTQLTIPSTNDIEQIHHSFELEEHVVANNGSFIIPIVTSSTTITNVASPMEHNSTATELVLTNNKSPSLTRYYTAKSGF